MALDKFFYVAAAGLGLFLIVGLLAALEDFSVESSTSENGDLLNYGDISQVIKDNNTYFLTKFVFDVLGTATTSTRTIPLGDIFVGKKLAYKTLRTDSTFVVKNGLFEKQFKELAFELDEPLTLKLSFKVNRTNRYGRLIIYVNNKELFRNYTLPGQKVAIVVDKKYLHSGSNVLRVECESSMPKLWAPTAYELTNFKIEVLDYAFSDGYIEFELYPDEFAGLSKVEYRFVVKDSNEAGNLEFYMNGKKVYEDVFEPSAEPKLIWFFRKDNLHTGYNVLTLKAEDNAEYHLTNNEIRIYYIGNAKITSYAKEVSIDEDIWKFIERNKDMLKGVVLIKTKSVNVDKGLDVYVNGAKYSLAHLEPYAPNYIYFDIDLLKKGTNEFVFKTRSYFEVDYIKIGIRSI